MRQPLSYPYLRQSLGRDKQANSVDVQLAAAKKYHAAFASRLPPWIEEDEQRFTDIATSRCVQFSNRKAGHALLLFAIPGDAIIVSHTDRLGEESLEQSYVVQLMRNRGLKPIILDAFGQCIDFDTMIGRLTFSIWSEIAAAERKRIGERTKATIAYKRALTGNSPVGSPPPGYDRDESGVFVKDPAEQKVIDEAEQMSLRGWSLLQIAAEFRRKGYVRRGRSKLRDGKAWSATTIGRAIRDRRNKAS